MSELIDTRARLSLRHTLLVTASAAALLNLTCLGDVQAGEGEDRPTVWIELGGQLNRLDAKSAPYAPAFTTVGEDHGLLPAASVQNAPRYGMGEQGSVAFQPRGSDWSVSASVQYGRSNTKKYRHQEAPATYYVEGYGHLGINGPNNFSYLNQTADYLGRTTESHTVIDFSVGKDVGLGLWKSVSSQIAFGVRFAQFTTHTTMNLHADPFPHRDGPKYITQLHATIPFNVYYQFYKAQPQVDRSFHGVGPSLSWRGSIPIIGSAGEDAEVAFDLSANVGVLFGRQKARIHQQTTADIYAYRPFAPLSGQPARVHDHYANSTNIVRSRSVTVPNIGGLAGISLRVPNAKVSVGYRVDHFFAAMDGGVPSSKTYDRGFYGPFASVSIGLGG